MGLTKSEEFALRDNRIARYAKALGHPARVAILRLLASRQSCICGDIVDVLPISQSTVSQHLKELKAAGLIHGEIDGPRICYCINETEWAAAQRALAEFMTSYIPVKEACC